MQMFDPATEVYDTT